MKYIKSKSEWIPSEESYKTAKVFITEEWVHNNLIQFKTNKTEEDLKIEAMKAPPVLELTDDEKFVDVNGNKLDIEVRGTKEMNNIYFKACDIGNKFKLGDVNDTLIGTNSSFKLHIHYKVFKRPRPDSYSSDTNKKIGGNQKALFLTFKGLTKLLYVSHSKNAEHFQDWANKILFTHQLGSKEEKKKLANKLLGIDINEARTVFNASSCKVSSIYLLTLGYVKDLRNTFNIDNSFNDNHLVVKYGRTDDLKRRLAKHQSTYNKLSNVNVMLKLYSYVDNELVSKAESDIKMIFQLGKNILKNPDYDELAIINPDDFDKIKKAYDIIRSNYGGTQVEYISKIICMEKDHQLAIMKLENENALLKKDNEILQLKLQLAISK